MIDILRIQQAECKKLILANEALHTGAHYAGNDDCLRRIYYKFMLIPPDRPITTNSQLRYYTSQIMKAVIKKPLPLIDRPRTIEKVIPGLHYPLRYRFDGFLADSALIIQLIYAEKISMLARNLRNKTSLPPWLPSILPMFHLLPDDLNMITLYMASLYSPMAFQFHIRRGVKGNIMFNKATTIYWNDTELYYKDSLDKCKQLERYIELRTSPKRPHKCYFIDKKPVKQVRDKSLIYKSHLRCFYCNYVNYCWYKDNDGTDLA